MSEEFTLDWSVPKEIDGENFPQDTLGREKYARFLTQFLISQAKGPIQEGAEDRRNYVLNLNSEWGSGKTYFLKRWSADLKESFPTVYIDAWQQAYSDDPLMTVISSVINQLRKQAGLKENDTTLKISNKAIGLFKAMLPGFARSISKRYFDLDPSAVMQVMQAEEDANLGEVKDANGESIDMSVMASSMVKHLIDEHDAKSVAINDLKGNIKQWIKIVTERKKLQYPAFIFIDELDRCRPSYAVEMLETIKHIFDIEGIVFVVATDTEQLQHAVKAIYGEGFDARLYLGRFFNSRFSLKAPDLKDFLEVHVDHTKLSGESLEKRGIKILPPNPEGKVTLRNIAVILDAFGMPPRTAIQIADRVIATLSNMPKDSKIDILMLTTLLCINEQDNELFRKVISGNFKYKDAEGKDIKLETFLNDKFNTEKDLFEFEIKVGSFKGMLESYSTQTPRILNSELEKHCSINLQMPSKDYFQTLYLNFLGNSTNSSMVIPTASTHSRQKTHSASPIYRAITGLTQGHSINVQDGQKWFKAQYYLENFDEIKKETYQDYVELASALDWIDGNSDDA